MKSGLVRNRLIIGLFTFSCFAMLLSGCDTIQFTPPSFEMSANWVSTEGKTRDQLRADQAECRRDVSMSRPPAFGPGGPGNEGWGLSETRQFDSCMKSKGWKKE